MLHRVLPKLRRLLASHTVASSPQPAEAGSVAGIRGLCTWFPGAGAPCPICGGPSAGSGVCSICGLYTKPPFPSFPVVLPPTSPSTLHPPFSSATASGQPPNKVLIQERKVLLLNNQEGFLVELEHRDPVEHFNEFPLLVSVHDSNGGLNVMLVLDPKKPWVVTEGGKYSLQTLKNHVIDAHREGYTLGKEQLSLKNLRVTSNGTFVFKQPITKYSLTPDNRIEDFQALSEVIRTLLKLLYGDYIIGCLPDDLTMMLTDLSGVTDPELESIWLEFCPALLSSTTYGLAWLKFHGLFTDSGSGPRSDGSGLLTTHKTDAGAILASLSYSRAGVQGEDWTMIADNDPWLHYWYNHIPLRYSMNNERHKIIFPRHVVSHSLDQRGAVPVGLSPAAVALLPGGPGGQNVTITPYYHSEAVHQLLQYKFGKWLPELMKAVVRFCHVKNILSLFDDLRFGGLFGRAPRLPAK